jgi:excisionase family DNA binding protein
MQTGTLVHVRRAAQILSCTERHIYNMIKSGKIKAIKIGPRGTRVTKRSIEEFLLIQKKE